MRLSLITIAVVAAIIALNTCETDASPAAKPGQHLQADRFATGMNGDDDLGDDIFEKGDKYSFRGLESERFIPLPPGRVQNSGK